MPDNSLLRRDTSHTQVPDTSRRLTKMLTRTTAVVIAALAIFALSLRASDGAGEKKLQQAIGLIEAGQFTQAAALLDEVVKSADHALAARALFHLADAQERQGNSQAKETYVRITQQFSGQREIADQARRRLARLEGPPAPIAPALRPIASGDDADPWASITPDGRFMTRADPRSGDVVVRDMRTGTTRRLMARNGASETSSDHAELPMLSPDGTRVVYVWASRDEQNAQRYQLRVMGSEPASPSRELVNTSEYSYFEPIGWSDARSVVVTAWRRDNTNQLIAVSLADGSVRRLADLGWRLGRSRPRLSPDGRYVAFSALPTNPGSTAQERQTALARGPLHIYLLPTSDPPGQPVELVRGSNINESPVWTPDGRQLLFVSNRSSDGFGLWSVAVENGQAAGVEWHADGGIINGRIQPVAMTTAGTLYFVPDLRGGFRAVDVLHADIDPESGRVRRGATRLFDSVLDRSQAPSWSRDGERVAFKRLLASTSMLPPQQQLLRVVIYSPATGKEEMFPREGDPNVGIDSGPVIWYHDGRYLLVRRGNGALARLNLSTGEFRPIESVAHTQLPPECGNHALAPNDRTLYLSVLDAAPRGADGQPRERRRVVALDLSTGDQKDVLPPQPLAMLSILAVSPDGRSLAMAVRESTWKAPRLVVLPVAGGGYRQLSATLLPRAASWTHAGLFVSREAGDHAEVVRVSTEDGALTPTGIKYARGQFFDITPDGSRVVFSDRTRNDEEQLLAYDNLLSRLKSSR